jgi:hypothetical protein
MLGAQQGTGKMNIFFTLFHDLFRHLFQFIPSLKRNKFDEHGKIDSRNNLDPIVFQKAEAQVGWCSSKHIGEDKNPVLLVDPLQGLVDLALGIFHIVIPPDGNGFHVYHFPQDDGEGIEKLFSQLSVGDNNATDHFFGRSIFLSNYDKILPLIGNNLKFFLKEK